MKQPKNTHTFRLSQEVKTAIDEKAKKYGKSGGWLIAKWTFEHAKDHMPAGYTFEKDQSKEHSR